MNVFNFFKKALDKYPDKTCLVVDDVSYTYTEVNDFASKISFILNQYPDRQFTCIYSRRSLSAFGGMLASLAQGKTYIPLNNKFPVDRNLTTISITKPGFFIIDQRNLEDFQQMTPSLDNSTIVIAPELSRAEIPENIVSKFKVYSKEDLNEKYNEIKEVSEDTLAYIVFTSGSTGVPKGVATSHSNVIAYINNVNNIYDFTPEDRFSQSYEITFDPSVHDMFVCWSAGASLYVIPDKLLFAPAVFIKKHQLTVWFSVPSVAQFMSQFRMLKENAFPSVRHSIFCAEPLYVKTIKEWNKACPNSVITNMYGPTETTILATYYDILPNEVDNIEQNNGIASLGKGFADHTFILLDKNNNKTDTKGELCIAGKQVTQGYYKNEEKTKQVFTTIDDSGTQYYKTGDIIEKKNDLFFFVSRKDFQVKIRGNRIELDEINYHISEFTSSHFTVSIPYPLNQGIATDIYTFIDSSVDKAYNEIVEYLKTKIPSYMIPKSIIKLDQVPLNDNGKVNRKALAGLINNKK